MLCSYFLWFCFLFIIISNWVEQLNLFSWWLCLLHLQKSFHLTEIFLAFFSPGFVGSSCKGFLYKYWMLISIPNINLSCTVACVMLISWRAPSISISYLILSYMQIKGENPFLILFFWKCYHRILIAFSWRCWRSFQNAKITHEISFSSRFSLYRFAQRLSLLFPFLYNNI